MSFSDNENWMDDYDFTFPDLKGEFEYSGLGVLSVPDEIDFLASDEHHSKQELIPFDNENELKYFDSFLNFPEGNPSVIPNEPSQLHFLNQVQDKQPSNQSIKNLLLKSKQKPFEVITTEHEQMVQTEQQLCSLVPPQKNLISNQQDYILCPESKNVISGLADKNNIGHNNPPSNNAKCNNASENNLIVICPDSKLAANITSNNNKKFQKIIFHINPNNNNQPSTVPNNIQNTQPPIIPNNNNGWTTIDQSGFTTLNATLPTSNILSTQSSIQLQPTIKNLSSNVNNSTTTSFNTIVNQNSYTDNNINKNSNLHNIITGNRISNSNNNLDNNFNRNITFNIGSNFNSNTGLMGEDEPPRPSHNSIEKRYRMSINDRIVELRQLLAGRDSKLSKSAVLRKAIEYIRYMVAQNKQLKQENLAYRLAANSNKDFQSVLAAIQGTQMSVNNVPSPPISSSSSPRLDDSSHSNSPALLDDSLSFFNNNPTTVAESLIPAQAPLHPPRQQQQFLPTQPSNQHRQQQHGMLDRSRLILCMFMLAIFAFNPLGLIFNMIPLTESTPSSTHASARMLQAEDNNVDDTQGDWSSGVWLSVLPWFFNIILLLAMIFKLFVMGEPLTKPLSPSSLAYWRRRNQAEQQLFKKCYVEAGSHLSGCLVTLGRPLPTTKFDLVSSLLWNLTRQVLHRVRIGMWLEGLSAWLCKGVTRRDVTSSASDAAVIYHKLLQLHMTDQLNQGTYGGINIALSTLNMAEVASEALPKETLAEIYTLVAMNIRMVLPSSFHFLARYFLTQARSICFSNCNSMPASLTWLNHPLGHRFFVDATWIIGLNKSLFTTCVNEVDPLAYMLQNFRESLLEKAAMALVTPGYRRRSNHAVQCQNEWISNHSGDSLRFLGLLNEVSSKFNSMTLIGYCQLNHLSNNIGVDHLSKWWFSVLSVAVHWLNEDFLAAESFYQQVENIPCALLASNSQLVRGVLLAFKARKHNLNMAPVVSTTSDDDSEEGGKVLKCDDDGFSNKHISGGVGGRSCSGGGIGELRRSHRLLCNKASELLRDSIDTNTQQTKKIILAVQLLAMDWLLVARTEAWQRESYEGSNEETSSGEGDFGEGEASNGNSIIHPAMPSDLCHFQSDLASLRKLSAFIKAAMPKIFTHQATARLMAGASPCRNMHLYNMALRKRNNTKKMYLKAVQATSHHQNNSHSNNNNNKCMNDNDAETHPKWKDGRKNEWKDGKKKDVKKEGTDLKKYIMCKKVVDDNADVEVVRLPPKNMVHKSKRDQ